MQGYNKQRGFTLWSAGFMAALVIIVGFIGLKLSPAYLENYNVSGSLSAVTRNAKGNGTFNMTKSGVKTAVKKQLLVNGVDSVRSKHIKVKNVKGGYEVTVTYHKKVHVFRNINAVIYFEDKAVVTKRGS